MPDNNQFDIQALSIIVWSVFAGLVIATVYTVFVKYLYGKLVKYLIKNEAKTEQTAVSLADLNVKNKKMLFAALKRSNSQIYRFIDIAGKETGRTVKPYKINPEEETFYLTDKNTDAASTLYSTKGSGILVPVVAIVVFFIAAWLIVKYAPLFPEKISEIVSGIGG